MLVLALKSKSPQIAVVEMEGPIGSRIKAGEYVKLLHSLEENDRVRAVVLDIDSPGGSATGSNYLHLGVSSLVKRKPVIAFIRGIGASGAYLLSCPSSRIIAIPSAIVGSIGVISMRPLIYETMERIGLKVAITKSDRLKDMGSMFREPTDEERVKEQELIDDLHEQFLEAVAQGRRLELPQVKSFATGEVFTARKGKDLGLVDELGDLERAIDLAAELGDTERKPVWMKPRRGLREVAAGLVASAFVGEIAMALEERFSSRYYFQYRM
jgi:protease-4